jgi:RNA polymerase sigma factor (sigma-70 family)
MPHRPDASLIDHCLRGDAPAWEELVRRYTRLVWSVPRKYGLAESDCEDVHQAVFATLVRHLTDVRDRERLSAWLITTATRECWRLRRRERARRTVASAAMEEIPLPETDPVEERAQLVREGLGRLNDRCRELLTELFTTGPKEPHYPTIAERLGMPTGSIGPTRARCLAKLEAILRSLGVPG